MSKTTTVGRGSRGAQIKPLEWHHEKSFKRWFAFAGSGRHKTKVATIAYHKTQIHSRFSFAPMAWDLVEHASITAAKRHIQSEWNKWVKSLITIPKLCYYCQINPARGTSDRGGALCDYCYNFEG